MRAAVLVLLSLLPSPGAYAQPAVRQIETTALYMPNLRAEPGDTLKTRTAIGCYRQGPSDYRCLIIGLRMQGAMLISPTVDPEAQAYLDQHCRGQRSARDYHECRFEVAFDYGSSSYQTADSLWVHRVENLSLASDYLAGKRPRPRRD